jgi:2-keto-4-pentenoate hydratase/2-oxohepta-3-ene-1,7-dioic acid hydratase in catechol pathway
LALVEVVQVVQLAITKVIRLAAQVVVLHLVVYQQMVDKVHKELELALVVKEAVRAVERV